MTYTTNVTHAGGSCFQCSNDPAATQLCDACEAEFVASFALAHAPPMVADEGLVKELQSIRCIRNTDRLEINDDLRDRILAALTRPAIEAEVRADERERCAKIAENHRAWPQPVRRSFAAAIRSPSSGEAAPSTPASTVDAGMLAALERAVEEVEELRRYANSHGGMFDSEVCGYGRAALTAAQARGDG